MALPLAWGPTGCVDGALSQKFDGYALGLDGSGLSFLADTMPRAHGGRWIPDIESCELVTITCIGYGIFSQVLWLSSSLALGACSTLRVFEDRAGDVPMPDIFWSLRNSSYGMVSFDSQETGAPNKTFGLQCFRKWD